MTMACGSKNVLVALVIRLGGVLKVAGVLNGDSIVDSWGRATAFLENSLSNTHDCWRTSESAIEGGTKME